MSASLVGSRASLAISDTSLPSYSADTDLLDYWHIDDICLNCYLLPLDQVESEDVVAVDLTGLPRDRPGTRDSFYSNDLNTHAVPASNYSFCLIHHIFISTSEYFETIVSYFVEGHFSTKFPSVFVAN